MEQFFAILAGFENILWSYFGFPVIMALGVYLTYLSGGVEIRKLPAVIKTFVSFLRVKDHQPGTVHPLQAFFACIGGCIGIGNIVGICTAVQIGGPGALFWIWMTALFGCMVKYAEVYLGLRYRVSNGRGGYNGGPMYFLQRVFSKRWMPLLVCVLLCIYGVEVYQFSVITTSITTNLPVNKFVLVAVLLVLVIFAGSGGVQRVGKISSTIIPLFIVIYVGMAGWVLANNFAVLPAMLKQVYGPLLAAMLHLGGL